MFAPNAEKHLAEVKRFCYSAATFKAGGAWREGRSQERRAEMSTCCFAALDYLSQLPDSLQARTWKDAFPLCDLLRGLILYLLSQMTKGQQLAVEQAMKESMRAVEETTRRLGAEHAQVETAEW